MSHIEIPPKLPTLSWQNDLPSMAYSNQMQMCFNQMGNNQMQMGNMSVPFQLLSSFVPNK